MGKIYVAGILFLGGPAGFYMALHANGGFTAQIGFSILSLLWVSFTWLALRAILKRNIIKHEQWMLRSFALTFAAVTLRIWVPILSLILHFNQEETLLLSPWLSWIPNLLIVEIIITYLTYKQKAQTGTPVKTVAKTVC